MIHNQALLRIIQSSGLAANKLSGSAIARRSDGTSFSFPVLKGGVDNEVDFSSVSLIEVTLGSSSALHVQKLVASDSHGLQAYRQAHQNDGVRTTFQRVRSYLMLVETDFHEGLDYER